MAIFRLNLVVRITISAAKMQQEVSYCLPSDVNIKKWYGRYSIGYGSPGWNFFHNWQMEVDRTGTELLLYESGEEIYFVRMQAAAEFGIPKSEWKM